MVRSSVLSSTRRRGSISFVSTTNPAAAKGQPETRVQRREADNPHPQHLHHPNAAPGSESEEVSDSRQLPAHVQTTEAASLHLRQERQFSPVLGLVIEGFFQKLKT